MIRRLTIDHFFSHACRVLLLLVVWLAGMPTLLADEKTSENDARLARWLAQHREADANKDGVLTESEARAYRQKIVGKPQKKPTDRSAKWRPLPPPIEVRYGPHERNVLDFYRADADDPTPVMIYFHGGGFTVGDKREKGKFLRHGKALAGAPHGPRAHHGRIIHHPMHGMFMKKKYDALGLICHVVCEDRPSEIDELAFLKKHLVGK